MCTDSSPMLRTAPATSAKAKLGWRAQRGLTLIELLIFIIIVSLGVLGLMMVFNVTSKRSIDPQLRKQALSLAEGFLEEVELARFTYCDPALDGSADDPVARPNPAACTTPELVGQEAGSVGRPFDNVNDYVNQFTTDTSAFNSGLILQDAAGSPVPLSGYTVQLRITPEALNGIASDANAATMEVLRITVKVTYNNGNDSVVLDGYRTRYAPHAVP
jgi:MSHA pilin protein MshD